MRTLRRGREGEEVKAGPAGEREEKVDDDFEEDTRSWVLARAPRTALLYTPLYI